MRSSNLLPLLCIVGCKAVSITDFKDIEMIDNIYNIKEIREKC